MYTYTQNILHTDTPHKSNHIHTHIHTYTNIRIHTYTHTYMHTQEDEAPLRFPADSKRDVSEPFESFKKTFFERYPPDKSTRYMYMHAYIHTHIYTYII